MRNKHLKKRSYFILPQLILVFAFAISIQAQTTAFNYQGKLSDNGTSASGNYLLQFKLFDASSSGSQIGSTISDVAVTASQGIFNVRLDFGAPAFPGADRFLEISVKKNAGDQYTTLSPRQQINSSPYSIRTLSAAQADVALNSNKLGGIDASQYVTISSVGNSFIKNSTTQQPGTNFNISNDGTLGGTLQANAITARTVTGSYGLTQTDGITTIGTYVGGSTSGADGGWLGTLSNDPLQFFINGGQPQMTIDTAGNVGIGTTTPQAKLHVAGNAVQDRDKGGMIKALLYVSSNGTLARCYNGITGASTGNCGFSVTRISSGVYQIDFGFRVTDRFFSASTSSGAIVGRINTCAQVFFDFRIQNTAIQVLTFATNEVQTVSNSDFFITVY